MYHPRNAVFECSCILLVIYIFIDGGKGMTKQWIGILRRKYTGEEVEDSIER